VVARPGMDLNAVQLALDCVSETAQCLRTVTTQNSADVLIAPALSRTAGELVLTLLRFDARNGEMRRSLHRQQGQSLNSTTLDAVPDMLRELFDLPPQSRQSKAAAAGAQLRAQSRVAKRPLRRPSRCPKRRWRRLERAGACRLDLCCWVVGVSRSWVRAW
jgi:hypothetical protein